DGLRGRGPLPSASPPPTFFEFVRAVDGCGVGPPAQPHLAAAPRPERVRAVDGRGAGPPERPRRPAAPRPAFMLQADGRGAGPSERPHRPAVPQPGRVPADGRGADAPP